MGDTKRARKKYQSPTHPWQRSRLEEEKPLMQEYALKNKTELWKMHSKARQIALQAKKLLAVKGDKQAEKEKELLIKKLVRFNLIRPDQSIDAALSLSYKDMLDRRLQTIVFRKNLSRSMSQARQFITHGHIKVSDKVITSPSYILSSDDEAKIQFSGISPLFAEDHPERSSKPNAAASETKSEEKKAEKPKKEFRKAGERKKRFNK